MNQLKRIETMQRTLRDCVVLNLLSHEFKLILADKHYVVCSLELDLNVVTYFVMKFDEQDNPIKFGRGKLKDNVINLENIKFKWEKK